jgi:hypothetical protein
LNIDLDAADLEEDAFGLGAFDDVFITDQQVVCHID